MGFLAAHYKAQDEYIKQKEYGSYRSRFKRGVETGKSEKDVFLSSLSGFAERSAKGMEMKSRLNIEESRRALEKGQDLNAALKSQYGANVWIGKQTAKVEKFIAEKAGAKREEIEKRGNINQEYLNLRKEDGSFDWSSIRSPRKITHALAQAGGSIVPALAVAFVTRDPKAVAVSMYAAEKGDAFETYSNELAKQRGIDIDELSHEDLMKIDELSDYYGIISGALESIVPTKIANKVLTKQARQTLLKKFLWNVPKEGLQNAVIEGGTEGAQRFTQNYIAKQSEINPSQDLWEGIAEETYAGTFAGLVGGVGSQAISRREEKITEREEEAVPEIQKDTSKTLTTIKNSSPQSARLIKDSIDTPITTEDISSLREDEVKLLGIGLQMIKESKPDMNLQNIDQSLKVISESGIELPKIRKQLEVEKPVEKLVEKPAVVEKAPVEKPVLPAEKPVIKKEVEKVVEAKKEKYQVMTKEEAEEATLFEGQNIIYKEGITSYEDTEKNFRKFIKKSEMPARLQEVIKTKSGRKAFASVTKEVVSFVRNPKENTASHEAVHAYIKLFVSQKKYDKVISYIKNKKLKGKVSDKLAEEWLADDFKYYIKVREMRKPDSKLLAFFKWVKKNIMKLAGKENQIDAFHKAVYEKKRPGVIEKLISKPVKTGIKYQVMEKDKLDVQATFEEVWEKVYGIKPDSRLAKMIDESAATIAEAMSKKAFITGKKVERNKFRRRMKAKLWKQKKEFKVKRDVIMDKFKKKEFTRQTLRKVLLQLTGNFPVNVRRTILSQEKIFNIKTGKHLSKVLDSIERAKEKVLLHRELAEMKRKVIALIKAKDLKKEDNVRLAMGFPPIKDMKMEQLQGFKEVLDKAFVGDVFLSQRKLETLSNTELKGIKTLREAREKLEKRTGKKIEELVDVNGKKFLTFARFKADAALAESHPFFEVLVLDTYQEQLRGESRALRTEEKIDELLIAARKSRKRNLMDRLFPTDKKIFEYLESENKPKLAKSMTLKELEAAEFIMKDLLWRRDYLLENKIMENYMKNYIMHIRRGFFETFKEDNIVNAFKEIIEQQQQDKTVFKIVSDTGEILALEKHFRFAMKRTGGIKPTQNIGKAYMQYVKAFENMRSLNAITPKLDTYVSAISPMKKTKRGLEMDRELKKFSNAWINSKKGRKSSFEGHIPVGGKVDLFLRGLNTSVSTIALGGNVPVGAASMAGEEAVTLVGLGPVKMSKATYRMGTKQGRKIIKKYRNFVGKSMMSEFRETGDDVIDSAHKALFILFKSGNLIAGKQWLLGEMTNEEFKAGKLSAKRLAIIKKDMGRWRVIPGAASVAGATSLGKTWTKFRTWAILISRRLPSNLAYIIKKGVRNKDGSVNRETQELLRAFIFTGALALAFSDDEDDKSFLGKIKRKFKSELLTIFQALDVKLLIGAPPGLGWLINIGIGISQLITFQKYDQSRKGKYKKGDLRGIKTLKRAFTWGAYRQFTGGKKKTGFNK